MMYIENLHVPVFANEIGMEEIEILTGVLCGWTNGKEASIESLKIVIRKGTATVETYCITAILFYGRGMKFLKMDMEQSLINAHDEKA